MERPPQIRADDFQGRATFDGTGRLALELELLRALCGGAGTPEQRQALIQALAQCRLAEPEHQIVFESLYALSRRKDFSTTVLRVHLNNRGFPDVDVEKYFVAAPGSLEQALTRVNKLAASPNLGDATMKRDS